LRMSHHTRPNGTFCTTSCPNRARHLAHASTTRTGQHPNPLHGLIFSVATSGRLRDGPGACTTCITTPLHHGCTFRLLPLHRRVQMGTAPPQQTFTCTAATLRRQQQHVHSTLPHRAEVPNLWYKLNSHPSCNVRTKGSRWRKQRTKGGQRTVWMFPKVCASHASLPISSASCALISAANTFQLLAKFAQFEEIARRTSLFHRPSRQQS
jgi:hypothetical protein